MEFMQLSGGISMGMMTNKNVFSYYNTNDGLNFYLVNCGSGLTFLIVFQNKTVMLFDCNLVNNDDNTRNMDYILDLFKSIIPRKRNENGEIYQPIDIFVNSHRDTDHLKGLKELNEKYPILSIWDSGQTGANPGNKDYEYYMSLRRNLRNKDNNNLFVPCPQNSPLYTIGDADVYCLSSSQEYINTNEASLFEHADKIQHTNCIVLMICYKGRKILLTGDSDWKAWKDDIVPNFRDNNVSFCNTDILLASHHGSRSFFTSEEEIDEDKFPDTTYTESIKLINPIITLISCAGYDYKNYRLPNKQAMNLYNSYTDNKQVFATNDYGTLFGRIDSKGNFSVTPERFCESNYAYNKLDLICTNYANTRIENGTKQPVNQKLYFKLIDKGRILLEADNPRVIWEVCNAGEENDDKHHEIYFKRKDENDGKYRFSRDLSFKGTHLLRCRVTNRKKKYAQTIIFVVHGV